MNENVSVSDQNKMTDKQIFAKLRLDLKNNQREWVEVSERFRSEMLNVVLPVWHEGRQFMVGEPFTHTKKGHAIYLAVFYKGYGKPYAVYASLEELLQDSFSVYTNPLPFEEDNLPFFYEKK